MTGELRIWADEGPIPRQTWLSIRCQCWPNGLEITQSCNPGGYPAAERSIRRHGWKQHQATMGWRCPLWPGCQKGT